MRTLLVSAVLLCASSAHAQYFGGSAFGDGVASTYGYGYAQPRQRPWAYGNSSINVNTGYQSFNSYPSYRQPYYATPIYTPRVVYPNSGYRPLRRW